MMTLNVELVSGCTEHCPTCLHPEKTQYMEDEIFYNLLRRTDNELISEYRMYGNGESMLHPKIRAMVEQLPKDKLVIKTNGNGGVIPGLKKFLVCLDGITAECHNITRTTSVIEVKELLLKSVGLENVGIYTLVHGGNWKEAIELYEFAISNGLLIELSPFVPIQLGTNTPAKVGNNWMMDQNAKDSFLKYFLDKPVKITHYAWEKKVAGNGVMIGVNGDILQCLGRRRPLHKNINTIQELGIHKKNCGGCPVNTLTTDYVLPPHIASATKRTEEVLYECALDPYH